jgi:preprotein translocase subunit SecB
MADKENGAAPPTLQGSAPAQDVAARQLMINAQYVKDLSFENPRAPQSLMRMQQQAPEVTLGVDVNAQDLAPNTFEVTLTIHAEAKMAGERVFLVELTYCGVATIANLTEAEIPIAIFIETPRQLFPFARSVIANATRDGGFMPLLINQIDFGELLRRKQEALQAQARASA